MRVDATGRTSTKRRFRRNRIEGQFAPRTIDMLRSPAFGILSLSARRILDRLEIELADHGGRGNGDLICTHDDFRRYGIHRNAIGPGLRELAALGFVEITVKGKGGPVGEFRRPSRYRLTYRHTDHADPTDDWRIITTDAQASAIAATARKQNPSIEKRTKSGIENRTENQNFPVLVSDTTGPVSDSVPPSISRGGER